MTIPAKDMETINEQISKSPSYSTVKQWVSEFKKGRVSTSDGPRSGRPVEVTTPDMIEKIHQIVLGDRRLKVREIAETCKMSYERVQHILHQHLHMEKLCARWVPRLLTVDQKLIRKNTSIVATAKINDLKFELMPHPPYSPDLAPSDYFLFPNLKKWLGGKRFADNEEVIEAVNGYFEELDESVYRDGINRLEHRYEKCISLGGDYVEK
ncbi:uncharacterized protein LOC112904322 [Agrilus planipennis]|uniref:Uncharacterized protein LOC112904322 n=2 Tax=Agrilus planipennis TaxID=224129 RepID=A0A7F5QXE8_AGRPL|nr:uncharacterized protein LOC112904322 [Agrilus planipennis]